MKKTAEKAKLEKQQNCSISVRILLWVRDTILINLTNANCHKTFSTICEVSCWTICENWSENIKEVNKFISLQSYTIKMQMKFEKLSQTKWQVGANGQM